MDVQRRVASKRSRTRSGKTPRKNKLHRNEENTKHVKENDRDHRNSATGNPEPWIENSFGRNELKSAENRPCDKVDSAIVPQGTRGLQNGAVKRLTLQARSSSKDRSNPGSPKASHRNFVDSATSTPKQHMKKSTAEPYISQHDSFNESDTLFAELDILNLPDLPQANTGNKLRLNSDRKTPNRTVYEAPNRTVYRTPQNLKTLSQVLSDHNYSPPDPDDDDKPIGTSRSLKDKLKKAMQQNAKVATPQSVRQQQRRAESLQEALKQAEAAKASPDEHDIGPFYGLPSKVRKLLEDQRGITKLYDWQHECLTLKEVTQRQNLIYSLPTSGGKTLVAEILILKELLCRQKDAILIVPFVSIVQEKVRGMSGFALDLEFCVEEYAAHKGQMPPRKRRKKKSLYICTIEKANSVINSLIEAKRIGDIGLCVVDELHMLGEGGSRGATLEMALTKIRHMNTEAQVVGMSATLSNINDLATFLSAHVYTNDFRPVELTEYVKMDDVIYRVNNQSLVPEDRLVHERHVTFQYGPNENKLDPDHLAGLVQEVIPDHSCLVFCATKKNCENVAELLCKMLPRSLVEHKMSEKKDLLTALWHEGGGEICPVLRKTVPFGIAYHHSGLTMDERKLVEEAYSEGILCLLCCTSTLAAGVNLPAKRVILRSLYVGLEFLSRSQYKQMTGRAGRAGIDTSGESILIVQRRDKSKVLSLATGPMEYCKSSLLYEGSKGMRQLLLTTVGLDITPTVESVVEFLQKTLCYVQSQQLEISDLTALAAETLQKLVDLGLVVQTRPRPSQGMKADSAETKDYVLQVSELGRAVFKGSIECDRGPELYQDLKNASESFVIANYLHMLYLVTPYDLIGQVKPNWMLYLDELGSLDQAELKAATLVGVSESYIARQISGQRTKKGVDQKVVSRFYLTLVLYNLWRGKTIWQVSAKFQLPRGFIQNLQTSATSFASCVLHFCQELQEFWAYQDLFSNFVKRLSCQVVDLIPLLEIPGVKVGRARQLYKAGYKTLQHIASANPEQLVNVIEHLPRKIAKLIVTSAQMVLQEKAEALMEEAQDIITIPSDMPVEREMEISTSQQFSEELSVSFSQLL